MTQALFYGSLDNDECDYLRQRVEASRSHVRYDYDFVQFVIASGHLGAGLDYLGRAAGDRNLEDIKLQTSEQFHSYGADHVAHDSLDAIRYL